MSNRLRSASACRRPGHLTFRQMALSPARAFSMIPDLRSCCMVRPLSLQEYRLAMPRGSRKHERNAGEPSANRRSQLCLGVIRRLRLPRMRSTPSGIRIGLTPVEHGDLNPLFDQQGNDVAADGASSSDGEHLHLSPDGDVLTRSNGLRVQPHGAFTLPRALT